MTTTSNTVEKGITISPSSPSVGMRTLSPSRTESDYDDKGRKYSNKNYRYAYSTGEETLTSEYNISKFDAKNRVLEATGKEYNYSDGVLYSQTVQKITYNDQAKTAIEIREIQSTTPGVSKTEKYTHKLNDDGSINNLNFSLETTTASNRAETDLQTKATSQITKAGAPVFQDSPRQINYRYNKKDAKGNWIEKAEVQEQYETQWTENGETTVYSHANIRNLYTREITYY